MLITENAAVSKADMILIPDSFNLAEGKVNGK